MRYAAKKNKILSMPYSRINLIEAVETILDGSRAQFFKKCQKNVFLGVCRPPLITNLASISSFDSIIVREIGPLK